MPKSKSISDDTPIPKRDRIQSLISEAEELEESFTLPSEIYSSKKSKKEEESNKPSVEVAEESTEDDDWMNALLSIKKPSKKSKAVSDLFKGTPYDTSGKKKKKKKKDGETIDYEEKFDRESAIIRNLLQEQTKFTNSLQQRYNILDQQKSSARGVGKYTTDLIGAINGARSLSKDLAKELINTKKTIYDLNMKEREKFAKKAGGDENDMGFSSKYLKSLISVNRGEFMDGADEIEDVRDDDDILSSIRSTMESSDEYEARSDDAQKYLKYERSKITVKVVVDTNGDNPVFFAEDEEGNIVDDYPVPNYPTVTVNHSTMIATDKFGEKYPVAYR